MKVSVLMDDGKTISQHFGRAMYYIVYDVKEDVVKGSEIRSKAAYHAAGEPPQHEEGGHHGPEADAKHNSMLSNISDCEALIARDMGWGAFEAIKKGEIKPFITDLEIAEDAAKAYVAGKLDSHTERPH